ncbi:hypothetical protein [Methanimicrococcus hongohii]|uniref:hypothetical protein n=1 Tax=Methanimicrococcus hongohii TaxID=3028295 RepID=UPI002930DF0C|nr:hypothetical protein [Methanimicrococcus sp. Hf6]
MLSLRVRFAFPLASALFYDNPFAFANVLPLSAGFCFRLLSGLRSSSPAVAAAARRPA